MSRQAWTLIGVAALVAVATGFFIRKKNADTESSSAANSQLPATDAEANYSVPPTLGVTSNSPTQVYDNSTYTMSMGNSLPISFGPK